MMLLLYNSIFYFEIESKHCSCISCNLRGNKQQRMHIKVERKGDAKRVFLLKKVH